jgi:HK97 family phage portal protein
MGSALREGMTAFWDRLERREEAGGEDNPVGPGPIEIAPPARPAGGSRSPFSLSMVYRAISIHAISAKQMSITEWREDLLNPEPRDQRLVASSFLRRPDSAMARSAFVELTVVSLASSGNAYWRKRYDDYDRVYNVEVLNPNYMRPYRDEQGRLRYQYAGEKNPFTPKDIQHLKLLRLPDTLLGLGPIQAARAEIEGALDLRDYSSNWFRDGNVPTGVLTSDQIVSDSQAESARARFKSSQGGKRDIAVLGAGLHYEGMFLNPADAQFLESQQFTTTQIARLFGTPSSLMLATVEGNSQTYQNVEQDWLGFVRFSNMQYLIEIEDALSQILPRGHYAKFNVEALLRTDTTTRYSAYKLALDARWQTINEVRRIENMPPLPGGDEVQKPQPAVVAAPVQEDENANV